MTAVRRITTGRWAAGGDPVVTLSGKENEPSMKHDDWLFWIWLAQALGPDSPDFRYLIDLYQTPYDVFRAESAELERIEGLSSRAVQSLSDKDLQNAERILESCRKLGIGVMTYPSALYPRLLREIKRPPVLLYYVGTVPEWERRLCVGMVGTRKMSAYGMEAAYKISYELARANAVVVSGMAAGIDGVCAAAALRANGSTVAVLGCGLDRVYPRHHGLLMKEIGEHGLLLSEYPPGTRPLYYHFPVRNRIISGLSHGVVVVEAGIGSGSLITAGEAVAQGRDVFAVPAGAGAGEAGGANGLLRDGAIFTTDADDILRRYAYLFAETLRREPNEVPPEVDREYLRRIGVLEIITKASPETSPKASPKEFSKASPRVSTNCVKGACAPSDVRRRESHRAASVLQSHGSALSCDGSVRESYGDSGNGVPNGSLSETDGASRDMPQSASMSSRPAASEPVSDRETASGAPRTVFPGESHANSHQMQTATASDAARLSRNPVETAVLQAMADGHPVTVDRLTGLGYSAGELQAAMLMLELDGLVRKLPGANYQIVSR